MINKVVQLVVVLLLVSIGTFALTSLMPGDPATAILGPDQPAEAYIELREELGLNDPVLARYFGWLGHALQGDLGNSLVTPFRSVNELVGGAFPVSFQLAAMGLIISLAISIPLAMVSARRPDGAIDRAISALTFGILAVPSFVAGLILIALVVNQLNIFPRTQWIPFTENPLDNLYHAALPAITIALAEVPTFTRVLRGDLVSTLQEDFILSARAKGMPAWRIMIFDAFRPSSYSLITVVGLALASLIGSTVIVETLFSLSGMGSLIVNASYVGNVTVVQGAVLVIAVCYVLINAVVDLLYAVIDPRIRRATT
ncbi:ABC transporter permease [Glaciibacter superstes]|uniref:ABC transporter permease n=1 Tax=Glaciibacter superstes TaxID=501023 RepID=UPI0003B77983|nr:ABC transporter permease [Glaciibacter superstes]